MEPALVHTNEADHPLVLQKLDAVSKGMFQPGHIIAGLAPAGGHVRLIFMRERQ